jgi:hypothetical protein
LTVTEAVWASFPGDGSAVAEVTDAVLRIGLAPLYPEGTRYVAVMVRVAPAGIVPREHGNAVTQFPAVERNVKPAGVASATFAPAASLGPLFVTTIVNASVWPGVTDAGPVFVSRKSAEPDATGVEAVAVLLADAGSLLEALTVAALTIGFAPAYPDGTPYVAVITRFPPTGIVPRLHGNAVVQAPAVDTNVSPVGVTSATETPAASLGPAFVTVIV